MKLVYLRERGGESMKETGKPFGVERWCWTTEKALERGSDYI